MTRGFGLIQNQAVKSASMPSAKRPGVTISRRDLIAIPVPDANLLWRNLHVRDVRRTHGKQETQNIRVDVIAEVTAALATLNRPSPWSDDIKASDEFLNPVFERFFKKLGLPNLLRKTDYHVLARLVPKEKLAAEVAAKLDAILAVAKKARPNGD